MAIYSRAPANPVQTAYLKLLATDQSWHASQVREYRDFYDGDHGTQLTDRLAEFLNVSVGTSFAVNMMPLVVDSLVERLSVIGFSSGSDDVDETLRTWWQQNRMDAGQLRAMTAAARDGMAFVIVEWNDASARPDFHVNEAWDGDEGVKVHWSSGPGSRILFASKRWREDFDEDGELVTRRRLNLYFADRVEKYIATGSDEGYGEAGWVKYGDPWPTPWTNPRTGDPLGIPVIPLLNRGTGVSELAEAIAPQKALNKTVLDILAAADVEGFGIYTKTGGTYVESPQVAPGAFWQDTDPAASFGKIAPGSITSLLETFWLFSKVIAIVTRRPLSLFIGYGSAESGESLKDRERGLVSQAKSATVNFGNAWEDVMYMGLRLNDAFGDGAGDTDDLTISTQWDDIEVRNEPQHRATVRDDFQAGIIDREQAWKEIGISDEDQQAMLRRERARQTAAITDALRIASQNTELPQQENANAPL